MPNTYTGTITKHPKTTSKTSFFMFKNEDAKQAIPVVGFFEDFEDAYAQKVREFKLNDTVTFVGRERTNKGTGRTEIVIEGPVAKQLTYDEAMSIPSPDLIPVSERVLPERKYKFKVDKNEKAFWSDGIYVWIDGEKNNKEKLSYELVEIYNRHVTSEHWLLPDWFSLGWPNHEGVQDATKH